jgi:hypothetical protein
MRPETAGVSRLRWRMHTPRAGKGWNLAAPLADYSAAVDCERRQTPQRGQ